MADGRHLGKIEKSQYRPRFEQFQQNLTRLRRLAVLRDPTVKNLNFQKIEMAAAAILKNRKIAISQQRLDRSPRNLAQ